MSRIYLLLALAGWFLVGYHLILWVFLSLLIFCCSWLSIFYRWQNVNNFYVISVEFNWAISRFCRIWFIRLLQAHWQITCISPLVKSFFNLGVPFASFFCPSLHPLRRGRRIWIKLRFGNLWTTNLYFGKFC